MRTFCTWCGVALLAVGAAAGLAELLSLVQGAPARLSPGALWFRLHPNSLVGFQALVEKGPLPGLWPPLQLVLTLPTWLLLLPAGALLLFACRARLRA